MEDTLKKQFGKRIQTFRKETGLSQEKFALKIEMDRTYYASVESGKRNVSLENIKKIVSIEVDLWKKMKKLTLKIKK